MKNLHYIIDREDDSAAEMNPLQTVWFIYTLLYGIVCMRRDSGDFIFAHLKVGDTAVFMMSVIALLLTGTVLIFNHRYQACKLVKRSCYAVAVANLGVFAWFFADRIGNGAQSGVLNKGLCCAVLVLAIIFEVTVLVYSARRNAKQAGRGQPAIPKDHSTALIIVPLLIFSVIALVLLILCMIAG